MQGQDTENCEKMSQVQLSMLCSWRRILCVLGWLYDISTPNMLRNRLPTVLEVQLYREKPPAGEPPEEGEVHYTIKDYPMVLSS